MRWPVKTSAPTAKHPPLLPLMVGIRMRLVATTCRTPRRVINAEIGWQFTCS